MSSGLYVAILFAIPLGLLLMWVVGSLVRGVQAATQSAAAASSTAQPARGRSMATVHRLVHRRRLGRHVGAAVKASWRRYVLAGIGALVLLAVVCGSLATLPVRGALELGSTLVALCGGILGGLWVQLRRSRPASMTRAQVAWAGVAAVGMVVLAVVLALIWTQTGPELVLPGTGPGTPEDSAPATRATTPPVLVQQPAAADMEWGTFELADGTRYRIDGGACPAPGAGSVTGDRTPTGELHIAMSEASGHQAVVKVGDQAQFIDPEQVGICGSERDALGRTPGELAMRATTYHPEVGTPAGDTTEIWDQTCVGIALRLVKERAGANRELPAVAYWVYGRGDGLDGEAIASPDRGFNVNTSTCER